MSSFGTTLKANLRRGALGAVFGGSLLLATGWGMAAQAEPVPPPPGPDGLVNVVEDGATVLDSVPIAQAAQAVAGMCAMSTDAVTAMVAQVDAAGNSQTACSGRLGGDVVLVQNLPPAQELSPVVPGTSAAIESEPAAEPPAEPAGPGEPIPDSLPDEPNNISGMN